MAERDRSGEVIQRLHDMNECVRIYLDHRDRGIPIRPGWLEEEVAATDTLLTTNEEAHDGRA